MSLDRAAGAVLARDIASPEPGQMPVLRAGATLTSNYLASLREMGVGSVWVEDEISKGIEPHELVPPHVREETARKVSGALTSSHGKMSGASAQELKSVVRRLLECIAESPGTSLVLLDLAAADAFAFQHAIDTCALGLLIGRKLFERRGWEDFRGQYRHDDIDGRLLKLGLGLLLHDAGKLVLPDGCSEDDAAFRGHPEAGAELLNSPAFSPLVRAVAREHHERWDGTGYPRGLKGTEINELARIAAVANVYDAITSDRPGNPGQPSAVGVQVVSEGAGTAFDPEIVAVFRSIVVPYPVGSEVTLPDGRIGVVTDVPPNEPDRPLMRLPLPEGGWVEEHVDLSVVPVAA